jgi:hypothetical protein
VAFWKDDVESSAKWRALKRGDRRSPLNGVEYTDLVELILEITIGGHRHGLGMSDRSKTTSSK